jgi:Domain of unknown function (DUF4347)
MASLMIVGPDFDQVADTVGSGGVWVVRPCSSVEDFDTILQAQPENSIERLDIVSHGGEGHINMGDGIPLFKAAETRATPLVHGEDLATRIRAKLTPAAQIRLLGCKTAGAWYGAPVGRFLLLRLAALFNPASEPGSNRVVFGTIDGVEPGDFSPQGLKRQREISLLYSSYAAIDYDCPTVDIRSHDVSNFRVERLNIWAYRTAMMKKFLRQCVQLVREIR